MTSQEIEDKKAIIAAVNKAFASEAQAAGISNRVIGQVISFLTQITREAWPYLRDSLDDLIGAPAEQPAEPEPDESVTPEDLPPTPESPK